MLCAAAISFVSLLWFGVNQTFGFWQDFIAFICAIVIGIIPLQYLKDFRIVLIASFFGIAWITSKLISLYNTYNRAISHNPDCGINCIVEDPISYGSMFVIIVVLIYFYSPIIGRIKRD